MHLAATIISSFAGVFYAGVFLFAALNEGIFDSFVQNLIWIFLPVLLAALSFLNCIEKNGKKKRNGKVRLVFSILLALLSPIILYVYFDLLFRYGTTWG